MKDISKEFEELRKENRKLKEENAKLKEEKRKIEKEFEELKARHAATVSNLQKALKIKANKKKQSRPLGAPKGHEPYTRRIPERIDYIKELNPNKCPHCNNRLPAEASEIRSRHVIDIKIVSRTKATKYNIHRKYCKYCKRIVEPEVPNVLPRASFGLNIMLLVMYLRLGLRLPYNKICDYFMNMYNIKINDSEIILILKQLVVAFGEHYQHLEKIVKLARVKYSDTTSWRVNGKNYHAWVFIACGTVLYKIHKHNNHKVALALFGKKQRDTVLVVDRFSAYRTLSEKAGFLLQFCWSHILEDSRELARDFGREGKYVHRRLKEVYETAEGLDHKGTPDMVEQLKAEIYLITERHYKHLKVWKFVRSLYHRDADNLFRFVTDPDVDPTNNISERELREIVIIRKISNGSRSIRGADITATLLSIIQTLRLNKKNVLLGLQDILKNPS